METIKALLAETEALGSHAPPALLYMQCRRLYAVLRQLYEQLVVLQEENRLLRSQRSTLESQVMAFACQPEPQEWETFISLCEMNGLLFPEEAA